MDEIPANLIADLAAARAAQAPAPVTIDDCRRALTYVKDQRLVENATHVRNYEFLLGLAGQVSNLQRLAEAWKVRAEPRSRMARVASIAPPTSA